MMIRRRSAGGALGDVVSDTIAKITGTGPGGSVDPGLALKAELNRFADPAAGKFQIFAAPLPTSSSVIDPDTAGRAMALVNLRLLFATTAIGTADAAGFQGVLDDANASIADPVGWANRNLPMLVSLITGIADANKLPAAALPGSISLTDPSTLAMIGLGAVILYAITRKKSQTAKSRTRRR